MPRIHPSLFVQARGLDSLLPILLPVCRDIPCARNELRWLKEHANSMTSVPSIARRRLLKYVSRRSKGEPLQYIIGTEYFGELEIQCRPGVLIPRPETAASVSYLVQLISRAERLRPVGGRLRVLDLCTGTGCIPLLFHHNFYSQVKHKHVALDLVGVDISNIALNLARSNQMIQINKQPQENTTRSQSLREMSFVNADVLALGPAPTTTVAACLMSKLTNHAPPDRLLTFDILISNPPYISTKGYQTTTSSSVRRFEPKLALVPSKQSSSLLSGELQDGDTFYPPILSLAKRLDTQCVLLEVADMEQARRIASILLKQGLWTRVEIWRDDPSTISLVNSKLDFGEVWIRGNGNGRSVFACRGPSTQQIFG